HRYEVAAVGTAQLEHPTAGHPRRAQAVQHGHRRHPVGVGRPDEPALVREVVVTAMARRGSPPSKAPGPGAGGGAPPPQPPPPPPSRPRGCSEPPPRDAPRISEPGPGAEAVAPGTAPAGAQTLRGERATATRSDRTTGWLRVVRSGKRDEGRPLPPTP